MSDYCQKVGYEGQSLTGLVSTCWFDLLHPCDILGSESSKAAL